MKTYSIFRFQVGDVLRFEDFLTRYTVIRIGYHNNNTAFLRIDLEYLQDHEVKTTRVLAFCDENDYEHFYAAWNYYD